MRKIYYLILFCLCFIFLPNIVVSATVEIDECRYVDQPSNQSKISWYTVSNTSEDLYIYAFAVQTLGDEGSTGTIPEGWAADTITINEGGLAEAYHNNNYFYLDFEEYLDFRGDAFFFSVVGDIEENAVVPNQTLGYFEGFWRFGDFIEPSPFVFFTEPMVYNPDEQPPINYYNYPDGEGLTNLVPIPSAVWLLGSGLIGVVGIRRKFNK
jgi:hypothetical protein